MRRRGFPGRGKGATAERLQLNGTLEMYRVATSANPQILQRALLLSLRAYTTPKKDGAAVLFLDRRLARTLDGVAIQIPSLERRPDTSRFPNGRWKNSPGLFFLSKGFRNKRREIRFFFLHMLQRKLCS